MMYLDGKKYVNVQPETHWPQSKKSGMREEVAQVKTTMNYLFLFHVTGSTYAAKTLLEPYWNPTAPVPEA